MKHLRTFAWIFVLACTLYGCTSASIGLNSIEQSSNNSSLEAVDPSWSCEGTTDLPTHMADQFEPVEDAELLNQTIGLPNQGKLCQGQVYQSKETIDIRIYRAWNSTNPQSKFGRWWAWSLPTGSVSQYRADYEICYQWSPLDKLVSCSLPAGQKVVVGTGQSAQCSEYLVYPTSETQQIYIVDAESSLTNCTELDGVFSWQ